MSKHGLGGGGASPCGERLRGGGGTPPVGQAVGCFVITDNFKNGIKTIFDESKTLMRE